MATAVEFNGFDHIEDADLATPTILPLPVKRLGNYNLSCWRFDPQEIEEINRTGVVWLVTETFEELKRAPQGQRWQPKLRLSGQRDRADR